MSLEIPVLEIPRRFSVETVRRGRLTFLLAERRGFCHGVERALRLAHAAASRYRDRGVFLTSPIVHNPHVSEEIEAAGIRDLSREDGGWSRLRAKDVVILPAFGVSPDLRRKVDSSGATVVDTTCGAVRYVWKAVDRFVRSGYAVVYHGRRGHEETVATLGRLEGPRGAHPHVLVETVADARLLACFLEGELDIDALRTGLGDKVSRGIHSPQHLERCGFANQTTMLARDSLEIARILADTQRRRFPEAEPQHHFAHLETICGAIEERQQALEALLDRTPDVVLVVGGWQSSNTSHLAETALARGVRAYHIEDARALVSAELLRHKPPRGRETCARRWLGPGDRVVGLTAGASTPESLLAAVLDRVAELASRLSCC